MRRLLMALVFALAGLAWPPPPKWRQLPQPAPGQAVATFAGGCFWCTEADFDHVPGVISTTSGYTGGHVANPTYEQVSRRRYRPRRVGAGRSTIRPRSPTSSCSLITGTTSIRPVKDRQFCDIGNQYRTAIFVHNDEERKLAEESKKKVEAELKKPIYTEIVQAGPFYPAEEYHQDFYLKNPAKYKFYRWNCGRDQRLEQIWGAHKGDS